MKYFAFVIAICIWKSFCIKPRYGIHVMAGDINFRRLTFNDWEPTSYIPEPQSLPTGTYLIKKMSSGYGELTIENGLQSDAVVVLSNFYNPKIALIAVYIQAGDTYTITGIEDGIYTLYFVIGKDWDNNKKEFRQPEMYSRFKDSLVFETTTTSTYIEYTIYTVTLHPVVGGQAETERVSKDEFPKIG